MDAKQDQSSEYKVDTLCNVRYSCDYKPDDDIVEEAVDPDPGRIERDVIVEFQLQTPMFHDIAIPLRPEIELVSSGESGTHEHGELDIEPEAQLRPEQSGSDEIVYS